MNNWKKNHDVNEKSPLVARHALQKERSLFVKRYVGLKSLPFVQLRDPPALNCTAI